MHELLNLKNILTSIVHVLEYQLSFLTGASGLHISFDEVLERQ